MKDNVHAGHRKRLKAEFLNGGFNDLTPEHKWLELLLFFCINQIDTNPLAHELIAKYKTLNGVFEAPVEELIEFKGLTENNVALLKMIIPLARRCEINNIEKLVLSVNPDNYGDYLLKKFYGLQNERLGILCLDAMSKITNFKFIGEGDISEIGISARLILKFILENDSTMVIICHNHPKSFALPSSADIDATKSIAETLSRVGVKLADHIIISGNDYISLAQSKEYSYIFT